MHISLFIVHFQEEKMKKKQVSYNFIFNVQYVTPFYYYLFFPLNFLLEIKLFAIFYDFFPLLSAAVIIVRQNCYRNVLIFSHILE